jgi:hypothetical protein
MKTNIGGRRITSKLFLLFDVLFFLLTLENVVYNRSPGGSGFLVMPRRFIGNISKSD